MPEYFKVKYPEQRDVFVDGSWMGKTNQKIEIGIGTYTINLGSPKDYVPKWRRPTIMNTTPSNPMIIEFQTIKEIA